MKWDKETSWFAEDGLRTCRIRKSGSAKFYKWSILETVLDFGWGDNEPEYNVIAYGTEISLREAKKKAKEYMK